MEIRATFDAMEQGMSAMRGTGSAHLDEQSRGTNEYHAANDFWDDDAYMSAGVTHSVWCKNNQGSLEELEGRVGATGTSIGLYQDCKTAVSNAFMSAT